ncbi:hypothetical protein CVT25_013347 [Psilocybe cyanescens]|uniref:Uncharacterized protein n=1 Tax=Psilocybe cyanescens TaxID=93625 RepID=A0A409WT59_PSICY|nr:hypothetical protein CVT25_013347 [Psilocybe cyanescens]
MASSEHLIVNPRPPDPGRNPTSHEGTVCSENNAPMPMDPMDSLMPAGKTIALLQLITNTPMIIVDEIHNLTSRLQDLQALIYREVANMRVSNVSKLYDLLEHYHEYVIGWDFVFMDDPTLMKS